MIYINILLVICLIAVIIIANKRIKKLNQISFLNNQNKDKLLKDKDIQLKKAQEKIDSQAIEQKKSQKEISNLMERIDIGKLKMVDIMQNLSFLQSSFWPENSFFEQDFYENFIINMPADQVGGDFYKFYQKGDCTLIACGNSGQTGITGLMKGVMCQVLISEICQKNDISKITSGLFIDQLRSRFQKLKTQNLRYKEQEDQPINFSVCILNKKDQTLSFSGSYSSMCLLRKSYPGTSRKEVDVHEFFGDKMNFSTSFGQPKNFKTETVELEKDDRIYLKTDGFINQRGGQKNEKFGHTYFRQMLMKFANLSMENQKSEITAEFLSWKSSEYRANDILIIGLYPKIKSKGKNYQKEVSDLDDLRKELNII